MFVKKPSYQCQVQAVESLRRHSCSKYTDGRKDPLEDQLLQYGSYSGLLFKTNDDSKYTYETYQVANIFKSKHPD